ncbi:hypothetical protein [Chromobacterium amazonense]|uniref:hypothetical protein n=1 Tax=Chromobacterium amazonense TaxID=1382803 RepID=UPI000AD84F97|nr:hypothetical protein [Chromobacterium amazonense]
MMDRTHSTAPATVVKMPRRDFFRLPAAWRSCQGVPMVLATIRGRQRFVTVELLD